MPDATEEWIFLDMNLLKEVIAPSLRLAIKLQHDEHRILSSSGTKPINIFEYLNVFDHPYLKSTFQKIFQIHKSGMISLK